MKMTQDGVFVGIDVSKASFQVGNDRDGRAELVRRLRALKPEAIGLEASGGYEREAIKALCKADLPVRRLNPLRVRQFAQSMGLLAKTDRIDAEVIARFIATLPTRSVEQHQEAEQLAELVTARRQICEEITRASNQAEHAAQPLLRRLARRRIERLQGDLLVLDKAIAAAVQADPELARKDQLLRSVPGVGPVFSHTYSASCQSSAGSPTAKPPPSSASPPTPSTAASYADNDTSSADDSPCATSPTWPPSPQPHTTPPSKPSDCGSSLPARSPRSPLSPSCESSSPSSTPSCETDVLGRPHEDGCSPASQGRRSA